MELSTDTLVRLSSLDHFELNLIEEHLVYAFETESHYHYTISFSEWPIVGYDDDSVAYMFNIDRDERKDNRSNIASSRMRNTIAIVLCQFMLTHPNAVVTLCETKDGREDARNRLFSYWYDSIMSQFDIQDISKAEEHVELSYGSAHLSLFYRKGVPGIDLIVEVFHELAQENFYLE